MARAGAMFKAARRIARRMEPAAARAFLAAIQSVINRIDTADLASAVASGNWRLIGAAIATGGDLGQLLLNNRQLEFAFMRTLQASGSASAVILREAFDTEFQFNRISPRAVLYAREQAGALIAGISADVLESIRLVTALGAGAGVTVAQQARVIREVVGLAPNHATAPVTLGDELRQGKLTLGRRLSAVDYQMMQRRIRLGTVDEAFVAKMQEKYARSLRHFRAKVIARTETLRSSLEGLHESWRQGMEKGVLPANSRRFVVVTLDDRLRDTHAAVPGMNPKGRGMEELFDTPFGALYAPPWEPNCRCGVTLGFPGRPGLL